MEINIEQLAFLGILFIALAGLWALVRSNLVIANLIPVPLVQELIKSAVNTALDAAEARAELTVTEADDELVALIRQEVAKLLGDLSPSVSGNPKLFGSQAVTTTTTTTEYADEAG